MAVDVLSYLPYDLLVKVDIASMVHGLEARSPFLDHEVAEWCLAMPAGLKQSRPEKRVLRRALAGELPSEIVSRPKWGLGGPSSRWLRGDLPPFAEELLSTESLKTKGWFDARCVTRTRALHRAGAADRSEQLLAVLQVQLWDEIFVRGRSRDDFDVGMPPEAGAGA